VISNMAQKSSDQQMLTFGDETLYGEVPDEFGSFQGKVECVDETIGDLTAPPESQWYHGRLARNDAEERLHEAGNYGCYLVRESERKPGSYVLSHLGKTGINHFRITALCGSHYIGGRQFDSLSDLLGYYTNWSDLLKGERLHFPVPPPEPVDDKKRLIAILPYSRIPETDELSFHKGDVFILHHEMGDGWLWVTDMRTMKSGIVYQDLMEDLNGNVDPVEAIDCYHGDITLNEAVMKLKKAGHLSYLVRSSEHSPGDYTLCFLTPDKLERFRIEKQGRQFQMGGRYFNSLEEIINRYRKDMIIDGYTLGRPVCRVRRADSVASIQSQISIGKLDKRDVYAGMRQSSGSNFMLSRDTIVKAGFMLKKSSRSKKWKSMYFVLNATQLQLFYFESEKRSKPKGLIDLNYASLYPVHESYYDRRNVFQLVVQALNHFSIYYLSGDTSESAQEWISELKPFCVNTKSKKQLTKKQSGASLKEFRSLQVEIIEAQKVPVKQLSHPYCVLSINDVKVCRTQTKEICANQTSVVWEEEFYLEDIPPDIDTFTVTISNRGRRSKDTDVVQYSMPLTSLPNGEQCDEWHMLSPINMQTKSEMGNIRLRVRFLHEVIMPLKEYTALKELILAKDFLAVFALAEIKTTDRIPLAKALLRVFRHEKREQLLLKTMNEMEIRKEDTAATLFRATSLATTLMDQYMKMTALGFVTSALHDSILKITESKQSCEINPDMLDNQADRANNLDLYKYLLTDTMESIFRSIDTCPIGLRYLCGCLQRSVDEKWPEDTSVRTRVVSGFIFLRLLCPAILHPKTFNLITETPLTASCRALKLIAKSLQNLSNLVEFGAKEPYMTAINPFIVTNKSRMVEFLDKLSNVPDPPVVTSHFKTDMARDLATIHQICHTHLADVKRVSQTQTLLKKLVVATELLTKENSNSANTKLKGNS
ncbi:unnamed protein product, partial [Owenia fusiformis]